MANEKGTAKECCLNSDNLYISIGRDEQRDDVTIRRCQVCDCRHFEAIVDPGEIGVHGARM